MASAASQSEIRNCGPPAVFACAPANRPDIKTRMAVAWPTEREELDEMFRFALFLGENREEAARIVREVLLSLESRPEAGEADRARRFCFREIRKRQLKNHSHRTGALLKPAASAGSGMPGEAALRQALREFPEPVRSVAALFYATELPAEEIGKLLDLSPKELAVEVGLVRSNLLALGAPVA